MNQEPFVGALEALQRYRSLLDQYMASRARELKLHPTDISAMAYIYQECLSGGCITPGELGQRLALSGPATTAVIDRLERSGYVERRPSPTDGRRVEIRFADDASSSAAVMVEPILIGVREVLQSFSPQQLQTFEVIMTTLANRMSQDVPAARPARRPSPTSAG